MNNHNIFYVKFIFFIVFLQKIKNIIFKVKFIFLNSFLPKIKNHNNKNATIEKKALKPFTMNYLNILEFKEKKLIIPCIDSENYSLNISLKPRSEIVILENLLTKKWRNIWLFRNSSFKNW